MKRIILAVLLAIAAIVYISTDNERSTSTSGYDIKENKVVMPEK